MEQSILPILAAVGGFGMTFVMGGRAALDAFHARQMRRNDGDFLKLIVNGRDYSVDLKTIGNGGSERIREALADLERC